MKIPLTLGYDSQARKDTPLLATVFGYFAAAMAGLARHCVRSNEKHNKGEPVHWARGKSTDHAECNLRHLIDAEEMKAWLRRNPGRPEREAVLTMLEHEYDARVWRASADSQEFYEEFRNAPLAFNAQLPESVAFPREQADEAAAAFVVAVSTPSDTRGCPEGFDRTTWPLSGKLTGPYPCVWRRSNSREWCLETDTTIREGFSTEIAARAAYWADEAAAAFLAAVSKT